MIKNRKPVNFILFFCGLLLFSYTILRASLVSFTGDECRTYLDFARKGLLFFNTYYQGSANHHLLNTWLMEISSFLFGPSDFTLRLPNVLAHLVFLFYSYKIAAKLSSGIAIVCCFLLLNLNPSLLEYFSQARGYGLSMALMMMSFYYAYGFIAENKSYRSAFLASILAMIGLVANFSLLNYFVILSFVLSFVVFTRNFKTVSLKEIVLKCTIVLSPLILFFISFIGILLKLKAANAFYFGGIKGFWPDTVYTSILDFIYQTPEDALQSTHYMQLISGIKMAIVLFLSLAFLFLLFQFSARKKPWKNSILLFTFSLLVCCFSANEVQHFVFQLNYPIGRTAFSYYILFILMLSFLLNDMNVNFPKATGSLFLLLAAAFVFNFSLTFNWTYALQSKFEAAGKGFIEYLAKNKKEVSPAQKHLLVGLEYRYDVITDYYSNVLHLDWITHQEEFDRFSPMNDYFLLPESDLPRLKNIKYTVLKTFPQIDYVLLANEEIKHPTVIFSNKLDFENNNLQHWSHLSSDAAYSGNYSSVANTVTDGYTYKIGDTLMKNKNSLVAVKMMLYLESFYSDVNMVISFEDSTHSYSYHLINQIISVYKTKEWTPVYYTCIVPSEIKKGDVIKSFLYTTDKSPVYIDDLEFRIISMQKED